MGVASFGDFFILVDFVVGEVDDAWIYDEQQGAQFGGQCRALGFHCLDGPVKFVLATTLLQIFGMWTVDNINSTSCFTSNPLVHIRLRDMI